MEVVKIAQIARIYIEDSQVEKVNKKMETVYKWLEDIKKIDVSGFEPLYTLHNHPSTAVRVEENPEFHSPSVVLANAPTQSDDFILVPKVVER